MENNTYKIGQNQSLLDIAIECYGAVEGIFYLYEDTPEINSITMDAPEGFKVQVLRPVIDKEVAMRAQRYGVHTLEEAMARGIGFWRIGDTFKIM